MSHPAQATTEPTPSVRPTNHDLAIEAPATQRIVFFRPWYQDRPVSVNGVPDWVKTYALTLSDPNSELPKLSIWHGDTLSQLQSTVQLEADCPTLISCSVESSEAVAEFQSWVEHIASGQTIQWLSQPSLWPCPILCGIQDDAICVIAAIGDLPIPTWPTVGLAMPTLDFPDYVRDAVLSFTRSYPGQIFWAIVANGSTQETIQRLATLSQELPGHIQVVLLSENQGFASGCNAGLDELSRLETCDVFGVLNDDVLPHIDCLSQLVTAMAELEGMGYKPGLVGPASNRIHGLQQVELDEFRDYASMQQAATAYWQEKHSAATETAQIRGLMLLIHPECLDAIGGFDVRFGLGNFEDDDYNLRARLAGFHLFFVEGAFLYHYGSSTFQTLGLNYEANIARNLESFCRKWQLNRLEEWPLKQETPDGVTLHLPLETRRANFDHNLVRINGEQIDLVHQAGEVEFVGWVMHALRAHPENVRQQIVDLLRKKAA